MRSGTCASFVRPVLDGSDVGVDTLSSPIRRADGSRDDDRVCSLTLARSGSDHRLNDATMSSHRRTRMDGSPTESASRWPLQSVRARIREGFGIGPQPRTAIGPHRPRPSRDLPGDHLPGRSPRGLLGQPRPIAWRRPKTCRNGGQEILKHGGQPPVASLARSVHTSVHVREM